MSRSNYLLLLRIFQKRSWGAQTDGDYSTPRSFLTSMPRALPIHHQDLHHSDIDRHNNVDFRFTPRILKYLYRGLATSFTLHRNRYPCHPVIGALAFSYAVLHIYITSTCTVWVKRMIYGSSCTMGFCRGRPALRGNVLFRCKTCIMSMLDVSPHDQLQCILHVAAINICS
ncbi:hypothetical protein BU24DRAFT_40659 [Aaosphaeria arxii CBS 175.79]|uniref:Uncharacterized protein n=1 Tax=Aaosphaeria arxii CBS 175.79 TaxID=1450172 RepID=A0A6A5Y9Y4_9PLEO|nr:uncharacterized protein BU24DRAFT_40659 [Aaosphaeria arxii CBS 175.79]KAF2022248.1 hypothetical protein BU24DRAFT_40659 [Aaosphaeria arxii CBS 175.79]